MKRPKRNLAKELRDALKNCQYDVLRVRKLKDGNPEILIRDKVNNRLVMGP